MLHRQKILLQWLRLVGRPVDKMEVTKWSFLLRHESRSQGGSAFYDFVPYRYGPFSFCLYQEAAKLEAVGYIRSIDTSKWCLSPTAPSAAPDACALEDARRIVDMFADRKVSTLINYVYDRYPQYTYYSEIRRLASAPIATPAVYTAGYERLSVDAFLDMLVQRGIKRIVDVRNNPIARRYGFHKSTLARLAEGLGIAYCHFPELGIVSADRRGLHEFSQYRALFDEYARTTLPEQPGATAAVAKLISEASSVLVCMEADPVCCHRSVLAKRVSRDTGLPVVHLSRS